jgi:hypothetical protein
VFHKLEVPRIVVFLSGGIREEGRTRPWEQRWACRTTWKTVSPGIAMTVEAYPWLTGTACRGAWLAVFSTGGFNSLAHERLNA